MMDSASSSDLGRAFELEVEDPPAPSSPGRNGVRLGTDRTPRPETVRLRGCLDDVMARLHLKLEGINGDNGKAIAGRLGAKVTKLAHTAFTIEEEEPDDDAT